MDRIIGQKFGKYRIDQHIGRGAMADVYKAYHPHLDRSVAIKVLHSFLAEKTGILDRFRREAQNVIALNHPNIVRVFDFDRDHEMYYMVMELIEGPTLRDRFKEMHQQGKVIAIPEVLRIAKDICRALDYAHGKGVIHRDIKPGNVMLDPSNRVVLTDFGLARLAAGPQFTITGAMVGTPAFISPEQGQGDPGDARSDLYSLGVLLFQLLTGQLPYVGETPVAVIFKHVNAPIPKLRSINPDLPANLENIVLRSMCKKPTDRYQSAGEMLHDLENLNAVDITPPHLGSSGVIPPVVLPASEHLSVSLHFVDSGQIIPLQDRQDFKLGRLDNPSVQKPDVDLTPYDGYRLGVSRIHAAIILNSNNRVQLVDLASTNGTWLNSARVAANSPVDLQNGDVVALGKLLVQILIRK